MPTEEIQIPIEHPLLESVSGLYEPPAADANRLRSALLLAHGAGSGMDAPLLADVSAALAERGFPVLRFNYPYQERARREGRRLPPDRRPTLETAHEQAVKKLKELCPDRRLILAGKSMGGRMGTYLAAEGVPCAGLVLLGYPLHPARKPEQQRSEHFPALAAPALFLQGTRDALCDLGLMRHALDLYGGTATLRIIEGGDHGFDVLKRSGRTREDVLEEIVTAIDDWERATFPH